MSILISYYVTITMPSDSSEQYFEMIEKMREIRQNERVQLDAIKDRTCIYFQPVQNNYEIIKADSDSETSQDIDGIYYAEFVKNMCIPELKNANDIVIEMDYADVSFELFCFDMKPTFRIYTDNEGTGFKRNELLMKLFKIYHMMYFMHKNYDMETGSINATITNVRWENRCFKPLIGDYDYEANGIHCLEFNKQTKIWKLHPLECH